MNFKKCKFISRGYWYKEGTEAKLLSDFGDDTGLFKGVRVPKYTYESRLHSGEYMDEEVCQFDEFDIYDKNGNLIQDY